MKIIFSLFGWERLRGEICRDILLQKYFIPSNICEWFSHLGCEIGVWSEYSETTARPARACALPNSLCAGRFFPARKWRVVGGGGFFAALARANLIRAKKVIYIQAAYFTRRQCRERGVGVEEIRKLIAPPGLVRRGSIRAAASRIHPFPVFSRVCMS